MAARTMGIRRLRAQTIGTQLLWLVAACVLPALLVVALLAYHSFERTRDSITGDAIDTAREMVGRPAPPAIWVLGHAPG